MTIHHNKTLPCLSYFNHINNLEMGLIGMCILNSLYIPRIDAFGYRFFIKCNKFVYLCTKNAAVKLRNTWIEESVPIKCTIITKEIEFLKTPVPQFFLADCLQVALVEKKDIYEKLEYLNSIIEPRKLIEN